MWEQDSSLWGRKVQKVDEARGRRGGGEGGRGAGGRGGDQGGRATGGRGPEQGESGVVGRVSDPHSFDPDPDPAFEAGDQSGSNPDPRL